MNPEFLLKRPPTWLLPGIHRCIKLEGQTKPVVVVPVVRPVPVAVRRAAVPGVVVPAAAAQHAVLAFDCP